MNSAIAETLKTQASYFWYYNNGITIIAEDLKRQAIGGSDKSVGIFDCKNVTVVNGAQTVGTVGRSVTSDESPAFLQARVIVVDDPDSTLGKQITRASNTQNKIDARNFVALDPEQERIRMELLIEGINYEYREGEPLKSTVDGFEFIEAVTSLACASNELSYVALSKGYVSGLYVDITAAPYKALFNSATSSKGLWSLVQLTRRIDKTVKTLSDQSSPTERGIVVHGNRFIMHCILHRFRKLRGNLVNEGIDDETIEKSVKHVLAGVLGVIEKEYTDAYLAPLFKNVKKCTNVRSKYEKHFIMVLCQTLG